MVLAGRGAAPRVAADLRDAAVQVRLVTMHALPPRSELCITYMPPGDEPTARRERCAAAPCIAPPQTLHGCVGGTLGALSHGAWAHAPPWVGSLWLRGAHSVAHRSQAHLGCISDVSQAHLGIRLHVPLPPLRRRVCSRGRGRGPGGQQRH
eukprot:3833836-Prymnesium_polylepis.2